MKWLQFKRRRAVLLVTNLRFPQIKMNGHRCGELPLKSCRVTNGKLPNIARLEESQIRLN